MSESASYAGARSEPTRTSTPDPGRLRRSTGPDTGRPAEPGLDSRSDLEAGSELPPLPDPLTRNTVDRHYTLLVDILREGGSPAAEAESAKALLIEQFEATHPGRSVPDYIRNLGHDPDDEETHEPAKDRPQD